MLARRRRVPRAQGCAAKAQALCAHAAQALGLPPSGYTAYRRSATALAIHSHRYSTPSSLSPSQDCERPTCYSSQTLTMRAGPAPNDRQLSILVIYLRLQSDTNGAPANLQIIEYPFQHIADMLR